MKDISILLTTYNRPEYLRECLDSLRRADLSKVESILIVDDASTNHETISLIDGFAIEGVNVVNHFKNENKSIKDSLIFGYNLLFQAGNRLVTNLDGDALVRNDFVDKVLEAKEKYPAMIVSGFNCDTLNRDGSVRHKHLFKEHGYTFRASVGGINMCVNIEQYLKYMKPALILTLTHGGNWDDHTCRNSMKDSLPICVVVPSVVQHIGYNSSMGHSAGGEPPDMADDFKLLSLPQVTLISVDDRLDGIIKAADISCEDIEFGAVKLLSCTPSDDTRVIKIDKLGSKEAYSRFLMSDIVDYIDTEYFMTIQADGYIISAKSWRKEFLSVDMLGAKWCWYETHRCCNGGVSLRTRRLHQIIKDDPKIVLTNDHIITNFACDHNIGRIYRPYLEERYGIKFADDELCDKFSIEAWRNPDPRYKGSFGFHGYGIDFSESNLKHKPY
jgi:hypothetical protein